MKNKSSFLVFFLLPLLGFPHGYWLEVPVSAQKGTPVTVKLFYGEYESQVREEGARLDKMAEIRVFVTAPDGSRQQLDMKQTNTHWEATYTPRSEGYYEVIGLNDTREVQDWTRHKYGITRPVQYLRTHFTVGEATPLISDPFFLDVYAQVNLNNVEIYALKEGRPLGKVNVKVVNPDGWIQEPVMNKTGFASVVPNSEGFYVVELEWLDKSPGEFKGKAYETVRYRCDMSFYSRDMREKL